MDPQFVLDRGREFIRIVPGIEAVERIRTDKGRANLRGIHNFTTEVKGQLVRGLNGGIKAGHPDAVVAVCSTAVIEVEVVEGGPQFHSGTGRRQGQPRIITASGASTVAC